MKVLITLLISGLWSLTVCLSQNIEGAWQAHEGSKQQVLLLVDGYLSYTEFDQDNKHFGLTFGGPYTFSDNSIALHYEFNSQDGSLVGKQISFGTELKDELQTNIDGKAISWQKIDDKNNPIAGVWWISERKEGEQMVQRQLRDRRTLKILSGSRFQWVAINIKTGEFSGTGGGTFHFGEGKYIENIEFFSRDGSRVGSSLEFNGELKDDKWHHSGLSSSGSPIYEVWSRLPSK
ncbi:hypothetical protein [Olivibacter sitiensis]|uniref:hypothetical protein n=1 Tax=Olivibacter sitiensis TaxID=376470 RepID=UPI0003F92992|nr:hypothetical protein [Olivibacter sitiensis]